MASRLSRPQSPCIAKFWLSCWSRSHTDSGYVLVVTLAMLLILGGLVTLYIFMNRIDSASRSTQVRGQGGFFAAEAGLNLRVQAIRDRFLGFNRPTGLAPANWQACLEETNTGTADFACETQTFRNAYQNQTVFTFVEEDQNNPSFITIPPEEEFAGLNAQEYRYDVLSVATDTENLPNAILGMRFKSRLIPLFQFAAFYAQDLDVMIPPNMTVNGPVHSNHDLYLNAANGNTLSITGQVTSAGTLYRGAKEKNDCRGTVQVDNLKSLQAINCSGGRTPYSQVQLADWNGMIRTGLNPLTLPPLESFDPTPGQLYWDRADLRIVLKLDSNNNPEALEIRRPNNSVDALATDRLLGDTCAPHGGTELVDKPIGESDYTRTETQLWVANAAGFSQGDVVQVGNDRDSNVVAAVDTTQNTITIRRQLGHSYQGTVVASTGDRVRRVPVSTSDTFYNYREKTASPPTREDGRFIRMLNIDMQALINCAGNLMGGKTLADQTDGGLVWFFTVDGPNSNTDVTAGGTANNYGVRLYNGERLAATTSGAPAIQGLTIVSDQAVYVRGDYNAVNKIPAAILADSLNVLSNAWNLDDAYSRGYNANHLPTLLTFIENTHKDGDYTPPGRPATNTTIQAAFLAGIDITGGNNGSAFQDKDKPGGGLNNYPRFHEDWQGQTFTYVGSMVTLGAARRVNGPFCGSGSTEPNCNIYNPPIRNWSFDTDFKNAAKLPPLTPRVVYLKQERFSRQVDQAQHPGLNLAPVALGWRPRSARTALLGLTTIGNQGLR
ncbi:hypothetical protein GS597_01875 [Synechococcales cyanobacterium C]|uniref:Uncharacterized protein n=1 Tax=Petrachloros mirabilis ULC683 TaxID=2781853 RepID=A0A8K2ABW1_9CYAN|nr:pilus assembly PilX N-terminal domain-containing protein [Petrachloros mirabilis]NCJ05283.1 hypothetical protein [Petrachloros mirabilis ULC683]